jgi:hypothetical protein
MPELSPLVATTSMTHLGVERSRVSAASIAYSSSGASFVLVLLLLLP